MDSYYSFCTVIENLLTKLNSESSRWNKLQTAVSVRSVVDAVSWFRGNGLEPILIKGWAIAKEYPKDRFRHYTDIDLALPSSQIYLAYQIRDAERLKGLSVDLHPELKQLDTLPWAQLFQDSQLVQLNDHQIRILCPEDHLRVLAVHWLIDGGWFRDRLWDIYYAVENRPDNFDWERCLNVVSERRRRWIVCVIGLTHKYLGLNIDDLPFADEAKDLPNWLIKAVEREWASGVRLLPLFYVAGNRQDLLKQIKKRVRPNPIHATVDMEGSFDAPTRIHYQIGTIIKRGIPLIKNIFRRFRPVKK